MNRRSLIPLGLGMTGLIALVALAAHGRPLSGRGGVGQGPSSGFFGYTFTSALILVVTGLVYAVILATAGRRHFEEELRARRSIPRSWLVGILAVLAVLGFAISRLVRAAGHRASTAGVTQVGKLPSAGLGVGEKGGGALRHPHVQWDEIAIVVLLLLVGLAAFAVFLRRSRPTRRRALSAAEAVSYVLAESLDDLRDDPDLRRAIVAAYARMEVALAAAGLPRDPAEAPLEYMERALVSLDASARSVRRLTELFEWAKFSHHEPEAWMRDEAVDALVAVRDELRDAEPAWA